MSRRRRGSPLRRAPAPLLLLAALLAGCAPGEDPPPQPRTVGSAVLAPQPEERGGGVLDDAPAALDLPAVGAFFGIEPPAGSGGVVGRREGFQDDVAVARFSVPADARGRLERGLGEPLACDAFGAPAVAGMTVAIADADLPRARCRIAERPDAGPLAARRAALVPDGDRVEVLLFGFTT